MQMTDEDRFKSRCDYDLFVSEIASVLHLDDETVSPSSLKQKVTFIIKIDGNYNAVMQSSRPGLVATFYGLVLES